MKKRLWIILLLFICGFAYMPLQTHAETRTYCGIHALTVDDFFSNTVYGSSCSDGYSMSFELYNNTDKVVVLEGTTIKKNKDYTLSVSITDSENNPLPNDFAVSLSGYDSSDFYVEKSDAIQSNNSYEFTIHYNTTLDPNIIYGKLNLNDFAKLYVGKNVEYANINKTDANKKYYTLTQGWYEQGSNTRLTENDTFQANKIYEYHLTLTAKEGKQFSEYYEKDYSTYMFYQSGYYNSYEETDTPTEKTWVFTYDTTQIENRVYGPIELNVPALVKGQAPPAIVSQDTRYHINGYWYYFDDSFERIDLEAGDVFETNRYYYYNIEIEANEGYTIEENIDFVMGDVDGNYNYINLYTSYGSGQLSVYFSNFGSSTIDYVSFANGYEAGPRVGFKPVTLRTYTYSDGGEPSYELINQQWYIGNSTMNPNSVFEKNRTYRLVLTLRAIGDYEFSPYVSANQLEYTSSFFTESNITSYSEKEVEIEITYTIEYQNNYIYDPVNLNVVAPVIGASPKFASLLTTDFTIEKQEWHNLTDKTLMKASDKFEKNKLYSYNITVKANSGKQFAREFTFNSNFEDSEYYDNSDRLYWFLGRGGAVEEDSETFSYSGTFATTDKLDDENYLMGFVSLDEFTSSPRAGENISYSGSTWEGETYNYLKERGLLIEKGWYEKGKEKLLSEDEIFKTNTTYEYHLRFTAINGKVLIPGLFTDTDGDYFNYVRNPYYVGKTITNGDNYVEFILTFKMGESSYEEDNTIVKDITIEDNPAPELGHIAPTLNNQDTDQYTVSGAWYRYGNEDIRPMPMDASEVFNETTQYIHYIDMFPKAGYLFSDDVAVRVNAPSANYSNCGYDVEIDGIRCYVSYRFDTEPDIPVGDKLPGDFEFKESEYDSYNGYSIPKGLDEFQLEVDHATGEYDININYSVNNEYPVETIDYDIRDGIVTFSNLLNYQNENPEDTFFSFSVRVNENDQYEEYYEYYRVEFLGSNGTKLVTLPTITNYEGMVDGNGHSITVTGGEGGTIVYSLDNEVWTEELPQITDAGVTRIYVKIIPDDGYIALMPIYGEVKLYREAQNFIITFHSNDGENQTVTQSVQEGEYTRLTKNTFTREGYTFDSWNTKADGTGTTYNDEDMVATYADLHLHAQWHEIAKPTSIQLNKDREQVKFTESVKLTATVLPEEAEDKTVTWTSSNPEIASVDNTGRVTGLALGEVTITARTVNGLEASCQVAVYDVFNVAFYDGETLLTEAQYESYKNSSEIVKPTPTKAGYILVGWFRNPELTQPFEFNEPIEGDLNLYAKWEEMSVAITVTPSSINFGGVIEGFSDRVERVVTVKNIGNTPVKLNVTNPTADGPFGSIGFDRNYQFAPEEEFEITLIANPSSPFSSIVGEYNGNYQITATAVDDNTKSSTTEVAAHVVVNKKPMSVAYMTHVQDYGDQAYVRDGQMSGTSHESKRLEAIRIKLEHPDYAGSIEYRTHVQDYGWMDYVSDGAMSGTSHESKRLEAIQIRLTGELGENCDVYYRVHAQNFGWMGWAKNDEEAGSAHYSYRLEGIEIVIVPKGQQPPARTDTRTPEPFMDQYAVSKITLNKTSTSIEAGDTETLIATITPDSATDKTVTWSSDNTEVATVDQNGRVTAINEGIATITATSKNGKTATCNVNVLPAIPGVKYTTHVQEIGWQDYVSNGAMAGTSGRSLRLEGIKIELKNMPYEGNIEYRTHVQDYGWMDYVANGEMSGTSHQSKRLEAIQIRLTGELAEHYDVYYRVHAQNLGWMGWAKNDEQSGSAHYSYRLEGIEIVVVEKGQQPPARTDTRTPEPFKDARP